jgi:small subunit ribosomal protein S2
MAPFIYGERAGIHIIDLEKTVACLRQACQVALSIAATGKHGGCILFVGTGDLIRRITYECATEASQFYVNTRWIGGTLTNRAQVLRNDKLIPDLMIVLDPIRNEKAILEAEEVGVPVIAICDTNCDPSRVTYPIPGNDDATASVELIARCLSLAVGEGAKQRTVLQSNPIIQTGSQFIDSVFHLDDQ